VRFELAPVGPRGSDRRATSLALGIAYDCSSWFPVPSRTEAATAAFVLSVVLLDGSDRPSHFALRGKSTLLVTTQRLVGVCPQGESAGGVFRADQGNVAVWTMALDDMDRVTVTRSAATDHAVVRARETRKPWLLLTNPRRVVDCALRSADLHDVVDIRERRGGEPDPESLAAVHGHPGDLHGPALAGLFLRDSVQQRDHGVHRRLIRT
jgi:hypothetical protein